MSIVSANTFKKVAYDFVYIVYSKRNKIIEKSYKQRQWFLEMTANSVTTKKKLQYYSGNCTILGSMGRCFQIYT